ncbi:MYND finger domain-containing protein [Cardiosporidium cionae]|uniref:MYND finger domain-containing protein n=1 Tax=Cardiosporidium cionae TaxID=476202 RepID=A0ABQ7JDW2_9APIC|nr:MYND finger domain-containing protein [Cardiosporidium cionae]|eukprot:KAF8822090.1 MYND finger domain-containing protein [Cardiosporidium cionae]
MLGEMDDLSATHHLNFSYVVIPADINEDVKLLSFAGIEEDFRNLMKSHFQRDILHKKNKDDFKQSLKDSYSAQSLSSDYIDSVVSSIQTYQIIPLSLPSRENGYECINCYIDDIGRVKQLEVNSRASRICSTDIRGDCFISKTFDNDDAFERRNFSLHEYELLLKTPPSSKNRWNQQEAFAKLLKSQSVTENEQSVSMQNRTTSTAICCSNCGITDSEAGKDRNHELKGETTQEASAPKLKHCGNCHRVVYCSRECQKHDWKFHRRLCQKTKL